MNKYADKHANDKNRVINSNVNKSGQNITAGFTQLGQKKPSQVSGHQSQRIGSIQNTTTNGRNSVRQQQIITMTQQSSLNQPLNKASINSSSLNKMQISLVSTN